MGIGRCRWLAFTVMLLLAVLEMHAQPQLVIRHRTRLKRTSIYVGQVFQVRFAGDSFWRQAVLLGVRPDRVKLELLSSAKQEQVELPLSVFSGVAPQKLTGGQSLRKAFGSALLLGGAVYPALTLINGEALTGASLIVPAAIISAGALLVLTSRRKYEVGEDKRYRLFVVEE